MSSLKRIVFSRGFKYLNIFKSFFYDFPTNKNLLEPKTLIFENQLTKIKIPYQKKSHSLKIINTDNIGYKNYHK